MPHWRTKMLSRRDALTIGLAASGSALLGLKSLHSKGLAPSPLTTPFVEPLPIAAIARPVTAFATQADPTTVNVDGSTAFHVHGPRNVPAGAEYYWVEEREALHSFHPQLPPNPVWGYDGTVPGPTFIARSGTASLVRFVNSLPLANPLNIGAPVTAVHRHSGFQAPEDDGYPLDTFATGQSRDFLYPNVPEEGLQQNEPSTLWYHDHAIDTTAENVYRGLSGFFLNFDARDSLAGEEDTSPLALKLPGRMRTSASGLPIREYDIPIVIQDRKFDQAGFLSYDSFDHNGFLGDKFLANGKIQPFLKVDRRKYRFRFLNGSNARVYELFLGNNKPFDFAIGTDALLLPNPVANLPSFRIASAERVEVVIDFSKYAAGTEIILENRLEQVDGRKPGNLVQPGTPIVKFIVGSNTPPDPSRVPESLRPVFLGPAQLVPLVKVRRKFELVRSEGAWQINNLFFDENRIDARPKLGDPEIWTLSSGGGWVHPMHIHLSEFFILSRNGKPPPVLERGRKDVFRVGAGEGSIDILVRFTGYTGRYVFHCHNIEHEDMRMMAQFEVGP